MATAPTAPEKMSSTGSQPVKLLPEEKFWQRYSPHQEMPLSAASSLALHVLAIGVLILLAWLGWLGFKKAGGSLPIEAVRFGGGGGKPQGVGKAPGIGNGPDEVEAQNNSEKPPQNTQPDPQRPRLDASTIAMVPQAVKDDNAVQRMIQNGNPNLNVFKEINKNILDKLRDGLKPGKGQGGPGSDGGAGPGQGPGEGPGQGPGRGGALTQREKRMLRWTLVFDTKSGVDYLNQLRSLGAILAIPSGADGKSYKIIRDLSGRGQTKLLDEDVSKIQQIFWIDNRPESVRSILAALHLPQMQPSHFVAFMPLPLEDELFNLEKNYKGLSEEQIHETKFKVVPDGKRGYRPQVLSQTGR